MKFSTSTRTSFDISRHHPDVEQWWPVIELSLLLRYRHHAVLLNAIKHPVKAFNIAVHRRITNLHTTTRT